MLNVPPHNGNTVTRSAYPVKTPLLGDRQSALADGPTNGCTQESWHSRQVLCRELTPCTDRSGGSERPASPNRHRDRVDFIPKGFGRFAWKPGDRNTHRPPRRVFVQSPSVWPFRVVGCGAEVTERYPPYSRLALERVLTAKAVGGEAESGVFSNEIKD